MAAPAKPTINGVLQRSYQGLISFRAIGAGQQSELISWRVGTLGSGVRVRAFQVQVNPASALAGLRVQIGGGNSQTFFNNSKGSTVQSVPLSFIAGNASLPYILQALGFDLGLNQDMTIQLFNNNPFSVEAVDVYFEGQLLVASDVAGDYLAEQSGLAAAGGDGA